MNVRLLVSRLMVWALLLGTGVLVLPAGAQGGGDGEPRRGGGAGGGARSPAAPAGVKPYAEVITSEAKSDDGLFTVHRIGEKVYFEIPPAALERELLWVTTFAAVQTGYGHGGTEAVSRTVRWQRRGDRILLRVVDTQLRAEGGGAVRRAVEASSLEPIIQIFDVRAYGANQAAVIDVTPLFTTDIAELSPRRRLNASRLDTSRTFLEQVKAFPRNIETKVLATYTAAPQQPQTPGTPGRRRQSESRRDPSIESITVLLHHSMVALPDQPMKPRLGDSRVGFFTGSHYDFSRDDHRVAEREYIRRWRLEKKDPDAEVSEPVKPIVYYIGREVPEKWRAAMRKGVEDWQPAFEAAGFRRGIVARDAPTEEEDPDWDPDDVRYSVIRWLPSTVENAYGPHVADPRTGEILDADIKFFHNILKLNTTWYFTQASPSDPRAQKLPLPDDLMEELIRYVTAHEVGHTLGLAHNMKASSTFTVEQLRSAEWTRKWGTEASIMDYGRFNYVAQPGDGAHLIPKLGPYDLFAIEWGYKPIPGAATPDDEKPELDRIAARQVSDPMIRFGHGDPSEDPSRQSEDLGSDPVAATEMGLRNIRRVLDYLLTATTKPGEDYELLEEMYSAVISQRNRELMHVVSVVGGAVQTNYHAGRGGLVYVPVPVEKQREAVRFLVRNAFNTPKELLRSDILGRIEAAGAADRILSGQTSVLNSLLSETRAKRMVDQAALGNGSVYRLEQLMDELRAGIWSELAAPQVVIDPYRRNLQRAYIQALGSRITGDTASQTDLRPLSRGVLVDLRAAIPSALRRSPDRATRLHLQDCQATITRLLSTEK